MLGGLAFQSCILVDERGDPFPSGQEIRCRPGFNALQCPAWRSKMLHELKSLILMNAMIHSTHYFLSGFRTALHQTRGCVTAGLIPQIYKEK